MSPRRYEITDFEWSIDGPRHQQPNHKHRVKCIWRYQP
jgi:hypothetical protein